MQADRVATGAFVGQYVGMSKSDGISRTRAYKGTAHEVHTINQAGIVTRVETAVNLLGAQQLRRRAAEALQQDGYLPVRHDRQQTILRNAAGDTVTLRVRATSQTAL